MEVGREEFAVGVEGVGRAERGERRNVRVLKDNYIQEFSIVGKYDDPLDPAGYVLDLAAIHAREEATLSDNSEVWLLSLRS
ncbi:protein LSM12 [Hordeum vulgare]|nr:protein LSM12 [Hordeum vulgare]